MILKNMTNYLKNCQLLMSGGQLYGSATEMDLYPLTTTKNTNYSNFNTIQGKAYAPFNASTTLTLNTNQTTGSSIVDNKTYICFGTGTTPVTENDYKLEAQITSGLSLVTAETSITNNIYLNDDKTEMTRVAIVRACVKNTTGDSLTIGEIGFLQTPRNTTSGAVMIHREVFENPVIIEAGAVATFEFTFTFKNAIT